MVGIVDVQENHGLCLTCNNAPSCYYRATRGPALFCELFDDYVPPVREAADSRASVAHSSAPVTSDEETTSYVGLCMNCENRLSCRHPKPVGGIWHCENYR